MNDKFFEVTSAIKNIKSGTSDIVDRMVGVSVASKESYKNMTDLENILEEFKTKEECDEAVKEADEESVIDNAVSAEIAEQFTAESPSLQFLPLLPNPDKNCELSFSMQRFRLLLHPEDLPYSQ